MQGLTRSLGLPLSALVVALVALWIGGLIALPLGTMVERSLVHVDFSDELTVTGTQINRLQRDAATLDLDIRLADAEARRLQEATNPAPSRPGTLVPSVGVPSASVPSAASRPAAPSLGIPSARVPSAANRPSATPSLAPSLDGASAERTVADVEAETADLRERRVALDARIATLQTREAMLAEEKANAPRYSFKNYTLISALHVRIFVSTLVYASFVTLLAFVVCYPVAYAVATTRSVERAVFLLLLLVVPYAINELLRTFAWVMILEREGVLNTVLTWAGVFEEGQGPRWVASNGAVFVVMIYTYLLFMMFPLLNTLDTLDRNQIEAGRDLGASTWQLHRRVVIPHARPGIAMGAIMVFMLSAGSIAVPEVIGRGMHPDWFTQVIYRRFFEGSNWNEGSAYSLMLLAACTAFVLAVLAAFKVSIRDIAK